MNRYCLNTNICRQKILLHDFDNADKIDLLHACVNVMCVLVTASVKSVHSIFVMIAHM